MKINYLFTSIVALALLAACDNNPQRINSNQNVSYNNLNNCSDIEYDKFGNQYCDNDDDYRRKRHSTSSYSSFNKRNTTTSKSFITKKNNSYKYKPSTRSSYSKSYSRPSRSR